MAVLTPVPYGLDVSVELVKEGDCIHVDVHAPMYINKKWRMPHSYASTFTDAQIMNDRDLHSQLIKRYGVK